jgi:uncharacterized protein
LNDGAPRRLPMFPLMSVLVPGAPLPLHVFEPRYRALMHDVMGCDPPEFGVVLIERGSEVGGGDVRTSIGTIARVMHAEESPDGEWAVVALGTRRIEVIEWLPDDPYPVALTVDRQEVGWTAGADEFLGLAEGHIRRALAYKAEVGDRATPATVELDSDRGVRGWQLVAVAPIPVLDKHALLAVDDPAERLGKLAQLAEEEASVLAQRMSGL